MAQFLAVSNRKGGVGKSTIAVMLAHAAAAWSQRRVLVMDLDTQCNASLMLIGGVGWERANREGRTIADYFYDRFDKVAEDESAYVVNDVGDVAHARTAPGRVSPAAGLAAARGPAGRAAAQAFQEGPGGGRDRRAGARPHEAADEAFRHGLRPRRARLPAGPIVRGAGGPRSGRPCGRAVPAGFRVAVRARPGGHADRAGRDRRAAGRTSPSRSAATPAWRTAWPAPATSAS